jgi:L-rhamnose mutarotase
MRSGIKTLSIKEIDLQLKFGDVQELKSLHRVLYESKFTKEPTVGAISFSLHIANTQNKIFDLIVDEENTKGADDWRKWQLIVDVDMHLVGMFRKKVANQDWWLKLNDSDRLKCAQYFFSPHTLSEKVATEIVKCT